VRSWPALDVESPAADWDLIQAALTDFDIVGIDDNAPGVWRVCFHTPEARDTAAAALRSQFPGVAIDAIELPDEDWAARSQAHLRAVRVGGIIVAPPWDVGRAEALPHIERVAQGFSPAITIIIQPSMGFGTGHHATTRLCLAHLQQITLRNRTAIDVGTGSGVLAIAASRLGAMHVLAVDDDPDAIQSARENLELNPGAEVTLRVADLRGITSSFDVVLANLTGGLLVATSRSLERLATPHGRLVLSGFMTGEAEEVIGAFASCTIEHRSQEDEWGCVTLLRSR